MADTPYYHITSRCVRRAFLCGFDRHTGQSYEHRRSWIENRLRVLASLFSLEVCAYAVMSNHYHLVVRLNPREAAGWTDDEVLARWTALFRGPILVQRYRAGGALSATEQDTLRAMTAVYRTRLASLSWFMKCLNEPIARKANEEDGCRGHFWEARFHSQPLRSDPALLAAMAYVDLNPVRAGLAATPETSAYTSLRARLAGEPDKAAFTHLLESRELHHEPVPIRPLMRFAGSASPSQGRSPTAATLPVNQTEYLQLVDATGRHLLPRKRGRIEPALAPILERLGLSAKAWYRASSAFRRNFRNGDLRLKQTA